MNDIYRQHWINLSNIVGTQNSDIKILYLEGNNQIRDLLAP